METPKQPRQIEKRPSKKSQEASSRDFVRKHIDAVIAGTHDYLNDEVPANYDAVFQEGAEPYFLNIWNRKKGSGLGYVVFHDFLIRVGSGKTFSSTDFTEDGEKLFQKAARDGLIRQLSGPSGITRASHWKVIGDPKSHLETLRDALQKSS